MDRYEASGVLGILIVESKFDDPGLAIDSFYDRLDQGETPRMALAFAKRDASMEHVGQLYEEIEGIDYEHEVDNLQIN
jgi:hypothetical protein